MPVFIELFGWYGMVAIIMAYTLVSFSIVLPTDLIYQILNGTGALGIVMVSLHKQAYQPAVLNIIWTIIAVAAVIKVLIK